MTISMSMTLYAKQQRLAQHYLKRLHTARAVYSRGDDDNMVGLKTVEQDWGQIQHWQAWTAAHMEVSSGAAALCTAYPLEAGEMLDLLLTPAEHLVWCEAALHAARQVGDQHAELRHLLAIGELQTNLRQPDYDEAAIQPILDLAQELHDHDGLTQAQFLMGRMLSNRSQFAEAHAYLSQALELSQQIGSPRQEARCWTALGHLAYDRREMSRSKEYHEQALRLYRQAGDKRAIANSRRIMGEFMRLEGQHEQADRYLADSMQMLQNIGDRAATAQLYENMGLLAVSRGDYRAARQYFEDGLWRYRELGMSYEAAYMLIQIANLALEMEDYATAFALGSESSAVFRQLGAKREIANSLLMIAAYHWAVQETEKLRACLQEGLRLACEQSEPWLMQSYMIAAAGLHGLRGSPDRGAVLLGLAYTHRVSDTTLDDSWIKRGYQWLQTMLDPAKLQAAFERGKMLDLETTARDVLADLQEGRL
jgi:tetratricopeptide (TPR) repeat protein